jgi:hypothetical protein
VRDFKVRSSPIRLTRRTQDRPFISDLVSGVPRVGGPGNEAVDAGFKTLIWDVSVMVRPLPLRFVSTMGE